MEGGLTSTPQLAATGDAPATELGAATQADECSAEVEGAQEGAAGVSVEQGEDSERPADGANAVVEGEREDCPASEVRAEECSVAEGRIENDVDEVSGSCPVEEESAIDNTAQTGELLATTEVDEMLVDDTREDAAEGALTEAVATEQMIECCGEEGKNSSTAEREAIAAPATEEVAVVVVQDRLEDVREFEDVAAEEDVGCPGGEGSGDAVAGRETIAMPSTEETGEMLVDATHDGTTEEETGKDVVAGWSVESPGAEENGDVIAEGKRIAVSATDETDRMLVDGTHDGAEGEIVEHVVAEQGDECAGADERGATVADGQRPAVSATGEADEMLHDGAAQGERQAECSEAVEPDDIIAVEQTAECPGADESDAEGMEELASATEERAEVLVDDVRAVGAPGGAAVQTVDCPGEEARGDNIADGERIAVTATEETDAVPNECAAEEDKIGEVVAEQSVEYAGGEETLDGMAEGERLAYSATDEAAGVPTVDADESAVEGKRTEYLVTEEEVTCMVDGENLATSDKELVEILVEETHAPTAETDRVEGLESEENAGCRAEEERVDALIVEGERPAHLVDVESMDCDLAGEELDSATAEREVKLAASNVVGLEIMSAPAPHKWASNWFLPPLDADTEDIAAAGTPTTVPALDDPVCERLKETVSDSEEDVSDPSPLYYRHCLQPNASPPVTDIDPIENTVSEVQSAAHNGAPSTPEQAAASSTVVTGGADTTPQPSGCALAAMSGGADTTPLQSRPVAAACARPVFTDMLDGIHILEDCPAPATPADVAVEPLLSALGKADGLMMHEPGSADAAQLPFSPMRVHVPYAGGWWPWYLFTFDSALARVVP